MGDISKDIQSSFPSEKIKALINIKYTANWLLQNEVTFFKPYGISPQQYNILRILRGAGEAIKVQLVKERMIEKSPNITRLLDKLFAKQLISRYRCEIDRRVVYIEISDQGLLLLSRIDIADKLDFLNNISEDEAKHLSYILDKIR